MAPRYAPPAKRSVEIAGHKTSVSLEPRFWQLLQQAAADEAVPLNALVARIDAERLASGAGLAGAIRLWLVERLAVENLRASSTIAAAPATICP